MGPDGKRYIAGGEVPIDMSSGTTPEETIAKMSQVRRAALAPADPSPQDNAVAAAAGAKQVEAQGEIIKTQTKDSNKQGSANNDRNEKQAIKTVITPHFDRYA